MYAPLSSRPPTATTCTTTDTRSASASSPGPGASVPSPAPSACQSHRSLASVGSGSGSVPGVMASSLVTASSLVSSSAASSPGAGRSTWSASRSSFAATSTWDRGAHCVAVAGVRKVRATSKSLSPDRPAAPAWMKPCTSSVGWVPGEGREASYRNGPAAGASVCPVRTGPSEGSWAHAVSPRATASPATSTRAVMRPRPPRRAFTGPPARAGPPVTDRAARAPARRPRARARAVRAGSR